MSTTLKTWKNTISQHRYNHSKLILLMEWHRLTRFFTQLKSTFLSIIKRQPLSMKRKIWDFKDCSIWKKSKRIKAIRWEQLTVSSVKEPKLLWINGKRNQENSKSFSKDCQRLRMKLSLKFLSRMKKMNKTMYLMLKMFKSNKKEGMKLLKKKG